MIFKALTTASETAAAVVSSLKTADVKNSSTLVSEPPGVPSIGPQTGRGSFLRRRIALLTAVWLVVLVPFLFLRTEWFGRPLSDQQIGEYLHAQDVTLVQHALNQIGDRMGRHDVSVNIWYGDLVRLAQHPDESVRALDAAVMGYGTDQPEFHQQLSELLHDGSQLVRWRAALSLVGFDDASGHGEIAAALRPWLVVAPHGGRVRDIIHPGAQARQGVGVATIETDSGLVPARAPITGRVLAASLRSGDATAAGAQVVAIEPGADVVSETLRGLARVGRADDLPNIMQIETDASLPERVRQQAATAERSIRLQTPGAAAQE